MTLINCSSAATVLSGCAALRFERGQRVPAQRRALVFVFDQLHEDQRQLRQAHDANGIAAGKEIDDVAKIFVVVAGDDGNAIQCGLKNVVSAARHEAAADEGDRGQRIERSQLSDAIDQEHAASERFAAPQGSPPHAEAEFSTRSATSAKRSGWRGARIITALG
jgi:outer membrane murein-binding lipoprotein Lpp